MTYDNYGNITSKNGKQYVYDTVWNDLLTSYNNVGITYDTQGNPVSYLGKTLEWEKGRQLKKFGDYEFTYNANGIRTSKKSGTTTHTYILDGAKILKETWGSNTLIPIYDNEDAVCGIVYNNTPYYFIKNLQGDVIAIINSSAAVVAKYSYDAWGVPTIISDTSGIGIASINPFRYRSYYYDTETQLYYLQSRYYDPVVGRFINGNDTRVILSSQSILSYDIFNCCDNCIINGVDYLGYAFTGDFWNYVNSFPIVTGVRNFAGFLWDNKQRIWYSKKDPIQRNLGYCDLYDTLAPLAGIFIQHKKIPFKYDGKEWMIWIWKGQYGITIGAEIGIYIYERGHWIEKNTGQKFYRCANTSEELYMSFVLYKNSKKLFNRAYTKHWWLTGFKPGIKNWWDKLKMDITINFKSTEMAKAFCKSAKFKIPSSSKVSFSW